MFEYHSQALVIDSVIQAIVEVDDFVDDGVRARPCHHHHLIIPSSAHHTTSQHHHPRPLPLSSASIIIRALAPVRVSESAKRGTG